MEQNDLRAQARAWFHSIETSIAVEVAVGYIETEVESL